MGSVLVNLRGIEGTGKDIDQIKMSIIAGSTSIQKKQKQLQELQKERASKGKHIIQEQNLQETCEDQESLAQDGRRSSIDGAEGNNRNHNQDMELKSKPYDTKPNVHLQSSAPENLSMSRYNSKVAMELQLKTERMLEAKRQSEGQKSPMKNKSPLCGKSPIRR